MRRYFAILSLVLVTFALGAKAFIPFAEVERNHSKIQLGLSEGMEMEVEANESTAEKSEFDGPFLPWMSLPSVQLLITPVLFAQGSAQVAEQEATITQKQYLRFGVFRI
jgi:hypothetical protein